MAKNGVNWEEWGFTVYGECPEYKPSKKIFNSRKKNISFTRSYQVWQRLIVKSRGQDGDKQAVLCDEWKDYNNYQKWHDINYYEIDGEKMELSYRIFDLKNHYISPDTSIFVPQKIANAFRIYRVNYENRLPRYISEIKDGIYEIRIDRDGINHAKRFDDYGEAIKYWDEIQSEFYIKLADEYKEKIPDRLYQRLNTFRLEVET